MTNRPALFLDRDGVLVVNRPDFVKAWEDVSIFPRALEACRIVSEAGFPMIIVTNQSLIGRGLLDLHEVKAINDRVVDEFRRAGAKILESYMCPHAPDGDCDCRKPKPGMIFRAGREHGIDLSRSVLVGDSLRDLQAAQAAGVKGKLVLTGRGAEERQLFDDEDGDRWPVFSDLLDAVPSILRDLRMEI